MECPVCYEEVDETISCSYCRYKTCKPCIQKCIQHSDKPNCIICRKKFVKQILTEIYQDDFIDFNHIDIFDMLLKIVLIIMIIMMIIIEIAIVMDILALIMPWSISMRIMNTTYTIQFFSYN